MPQFVISTLLFLTIEFSIEMMFPGIIFFELPFSEARICCESLVGVAEGTTVFDWIMAEGPAMKILLTSFVKEVETALPLRSSFFVGTTR